MFWLITQVLSISTYENVVFQATDVSADSPEPFPFHRIQKFQEILYMHIQAWPLNKKKQYVPFFLSQCKHINSKKLSGLDARDLTLQLRVYTALPRDLILFFTMTVRQFTTTDNIEFQRIQCLLLSSINICTSDIYILCFPCSLTDLGMGACHLSSIYYQCFVFVFHSNRQCASLGYIQNIKSRDIRWEYSFKSPFW